MSHTTIHNIEQYNKFFKQATTHPLVSVARLEEASLTLFDPIDFGMYCVILMDIDFGELVKNGERMRYRPGTIFTLKPGEVVSTNLDPNAHPRGWMLAFHPQLIINTGLGRDFYMFNYFDNHVDEALELTESERSVMINCFANIDAELHAPDDELTGHMLRLGIGQLLSYCKRFFERQFDKKNQRSSDFVRRLDVLLDTYLAPGSPLPRQFGQPTVAWCSEQFHLSANYFGDVVKRELHITAQEYISNKIVERARSLLANPSLSINNVAESLGFAYANHFTRFFRQQTGVSPSQFRRDREAI